ncbi:MAG TPA: transposase, partial [Trebonia sp.]
MRDWALGRVIWVADRGFTSRDNRRFLQQGGGAYIIGEKLRTGKARAKAEENLDGKYLLRTSDPKMTAEDIAVGYKQLLEVERGWRDMKQVID